MSLVVLLLQVHVSHLAEVHVGVDVLVQDVVLQQFFELTNDLVFQFLRIFTAGVGLGLHFFVQLVESLNLGSVDVVVVEVVVELANHLLLLGAHSELVDIHAVLPHFAARRLGGTLIDVRPAPGEVPVQEPLQVLRRQFGARESQFVVLQVFFFYVLLPGFRVVHDPNSIAIAAFALLGGVIM